MSEQRSRSASLLGVVAATLRGGLAIPQADALYELDQVVDAIAGGADPHELLTY